MCGFVCVGLGIQRAYIVRVKCTCTMYVYNVHACAYLCVFKRVHVDACVLCIRTVCVP